MAEARPATRQDIEELFSELVKMISKKIDRMADKKLEPYLMRLEQHLIEIKTELDEMKKLLIGVTEANTQYRYFKQKEKREIN